MSLAEEKLDEALSPLRRLHLDRLEAFLASVAAMGRPVRAEPWRCDAFGRTRRDGPLRLPSRLDWGVEGDPMARVAATDPAAEPPLEVEFVPFAALAPGGLSVEIRPFAWDDAVLTLDFGREAPDWEPLRRWFLEFSQPGLGEDLAAPIGALHALQGPAMSDGRRRARLRVDFGSAPVACICALILALDETRAVAARLGAAAEI